MLTDFLNSFTAGFRTKFATKPLPYYPP